MFMLRLFDESDPVHPIDARLLRDGIETEVPVERVGPHRRLEDAFLTLIGGPA